MTRSLRTPADVQRRLSPLEKAMLVGEILAAYASTRWYVRGRRITDVVAELRGAAAGDDATPERWQQVLGFRLGKAVQRSLRLLPLDARCLVRSLVLTRLLGRRGIPHSLLIGVREGPDFAAHAWVESGGLALLPTGDEFAPLVRL